MSTCSSRHRATAPRRRVQRWAATSVALLLLGSALAGCQRRTEQAAQPDAMTPGDPTAAASARPGEGSRTGELGQTPGTAAGTGTTSSDGMTGGMNATGPASAPTVPNGASGPHSGGGTP